MTHRQSVPDLQNLYNELGKVCRAASYTKIISCADKILTAFKNDVYACKCKVVALIHMERFDDCLDFIRKNKLSDCILEKGYCEYRLHKLNDALKTVDGCSEDNLGISELRAQIFYRLEEFETSAKCYETLIKSCADEYEEERFTNLVAAKAALSCMCGKQLPLNYSPAMFETDFNAACYCIGQRDYITAMDYLNKAEKSCLEMFKNDAEATEDQILQETAPIRVQKAFILQMQKKEQDASELYHSVMRQRAGDPSLIAVAANNLICINREQNVFDTRKRIKAASIDALQHKLFQTQRSSILVNQALFYLHTTQLEACRVKIKAVLEDNPGYVRGILLSAVHLARSKQLAAAIKLLENYVQTPAFIEERDDKSRLSVVLLLVHMQLMQCSSSSEASMGPLKGQLSVTEAQSLVDLLGRLLPKHLLNLPAVIALRVALILSPTSLTKKDAGDEDTEKKRKTILTSARQMFSEALTYWSANESLDVCLEKLMDQSIQFFYHHGFPEDAARLLETRLADVKKAVATPGKKAAGAAARMKQQQTSLLALLVQSYSKFDHAKAETASRELEFKDPLTEAEIDSLEASFLYGVKNIKRGAKNESEKPKSKSDGDKKIAAKAATPASATKSIQPKKRRKIRLPKNYEPGVPPDAERWLPKRERQGYRGKRRDRRTNANMLRGPQGMSTANTDLDMGNRSPKNAPAGATPPAAPGSGGQSQGRRPQQGKSHKGGKNKKRR